MADMPARTRPTNNLTPEEVATDFGVTPLALIRFARKHGIPLIELSRGVYRLTPAAVKQLQEAGQCRSRSTAGETPAPSKLPGLSGRLARTQASAFADALALTTSASPKKKRSRSKAKSSVPHGTANVLPIGSLAKR